MTKIIKYRGATLVVGGDGLVDYDLQLPHQTIGGMARSIDDAKAKVDAALDDETERH